MKTTGQLSPSLLGLTAAAVLLAGTVSAQITAPPTSPSASTPAATSSAPARNANVSPVQGVGPTLGPPSGAPASAAPAAAATAAPPAPDIRDIHDPIPLTFWEQHGLQIAVGTPLAVLLLGFLLWLVLRKKAKIPLTPIERARLELAAARVEIATGGDKAFAVQVSDTVRRYLEDACRMPAPERTTEEFLVEAAKHPWLRGELTDLLRKFLEWCDLAKFAGQQFGQPQREQLLAAAAQFLEAAENHLHPPAKNAPTKPSPSAPPPLAGTTRPSGTA